MTADLPPEVAHVLEHGAFCFATAATDRGPHLTPLVYALSGGQLWLTTSRGSVKARAWRRDPRVSGLVRAGDLAVSFTGVTRAYDALDPGTWAASIGAAPSLTMAAARFTRKNARFFAGYAVDARQVPLAWTPPGRVFVRVELERAAVVGADMRGGWGHWDDALASHKTFRAVSRGNDPLGTLPAGVAKLVGRAGRGGLAVEAPAGPGRGPGTAVLPVHWVAEAAALYAALPASALRLLGGGTPNARVALAVDRASWWRASDMAGAMVQANGAFFLPDRLDSGARSAEARIKATGVDPEGAALVRITPRRLVWWRGWSSGTAEPS